jgi:5-formyltetrahydrofolate cyclo-ligase
MKKNCLRQQIKNSLKQMSPDKRQQKSRGGGVNLSETEEFRQARVVMLFLSLPHEIDTAFALQFAFSEEKTVLVPKMIWGDSKIIPVRLPALDAECEQDRYGLRIPVHAEHIPAGEIDLVVVPGLAFDAQARRLGRGGGFYDRFLAQPDLQARTCGFAFQEQVLPEIPTESNDRPVDMLVTDRQIFRFEKKLGL